MRRWFKFAAAVIATVLIAGCVQPGEKAPKKAEIEVPLGVLVDLSGPHMVRTLKTRLQLQLKI